MAEKYYITTAIAYASGKPHIGNTYEIVLADFLARFRRAQGYDVRLQTGTDEHGEKVELKAAAAGVTPKKFVDDVAAEIRRIWDLMNSSYDKFIRTTDDYHEKEVQKIFDRLLAQGDIYKGSYKGLYCTPCESFWTESQLMDGKCPDCGREVTEAEEEAYFFRMSKYADRLMKYYEEHPDFILPVSRRNEMVNNFLKPGLQDLCVSRSTFSWGIPVKTDPKHVVYVWLDALTNYITGLGYHSKGKSGADYERYWPADVHVIGKDIVRFHTIYWPIFLMALGEPLPKHVYGHPWLLQDGGKMSKSKGNVLYADDLADVFGVDALRYYLLSAMPYENDGLISWELVSDTVNSELANVYGNLVNRTVAMSNKYFGGVVSDPHAAEPVDEELKAVATGAYKKVAKLVDEFRVADAVGEIMSVFRRANKYIDETAPWVLARDEAKRARLATVLYNARVRHARSGGKSRPRVRDGAQSVRQARRVRLAPRRHQSRGKAGDPLPKVRHRRGGGKGGKNVRGKKSGGRDRQGRTGKGAGERKAGARKGGSARGHRDYDRHRRVQVRVFEGGAHSHRREGGEGG